MTGRVFSQAVENATALIKVDAKGAFNRAFIIAFETFLGALLIGGVGAVAAIFRGKETVVHAVDAINGMLSLAALNWHAVLAMAFVPVAIVLPQRFLVRRLPAFMGAIALTVSFDIASGAQGVVLGMFLPALTEMPPIQLCTKEIVVLGSLYTYQFMLFALAQLVNGEAQKTLPLKPKHILLIAGILLTMVLIVVQTDWAFVGHPDQKGADRETAAGKTN